MKLEREKAACEQQLRDNVFVRYSGSREPTPIPDELTTLVLYFKCALV